MATISQAVDLTPALPWRVEQPQPAAIDRAAVMRRLEVLAKLLDDAFVLPGTRIRLGWDSLIGFVPVVGDACTTCLSAYFLWEARRLGVSKWTLVRMLANVGIDFAIGIVPVAGDLMDVAWKANRRNLRLLREALSRG